MDYSHSESELANCSGTFSNSCKNDIFSKMLNTVDYLDSKISGKFIIYRSFFDVPHIVEFQIDESKKTHYDSFTPERTNAAIAQESFRINGRHLTVSHSTNTYTVWPSADSYRRDAHEIRFMEELGQIVLVSRTVESIPSSTAECLANYNIVYYWLNDFDTWEIEDVTTYLGRECWVLSGDLSQISKIIRSMYHIVSIAITLYVDCITGVLLKYYLYDVNRKTTDYMYVEKLLFGDSADSVTEFSADTVAGYRNISPWGLDLKSLEVV